MRHETGKVDGAPWPGATAAGDTDGWQLMIQALPELVCRALPDTTLTWVNDAYCRYVGRTREQLVGRPFLDLLAEPDRELVRSRMAALSPERPTDEADLRVVTGGAQIHWQHWFGCGRFDADGRLLELCGVGRDITSQRMGEELLQEAGRQYRSLFEYSRDLVMIVDAEGRFLEVNDVACAATGFTRPELLAQRVMDFDTPDTQPTTLERVATVLDEGFGAFELPIITRDGRAIPAAIRAWRIDWQGQPAVLVVLRDQSVEQTARRALDLSQGLLMATLDALPNEVAILDQDSVVVAVNRAWREYAGGVEHGVGQSYLAVCDAADLPDARAVAAGLREVLAGRVEQFSHEYLVHPGGVERWYEVSITRFGTADETWAVMAHHDVTASRQAANAQRRLNDELERRVAERTAELDELNEQLRREVDARDLITTALRRSEGREKANNAGLRAVVTMADELLACADLDTFYRRTIELMRERLGLERCAVFLREPGGFRGTYGVNRHGLLVNERDLSFRPDPRGLAFMDEAAGGSGWAVRMSTRREWDGEASPEVEPGWVAVTPLMSEGRLVGVMYNDNLLSGSPVDPVQQNVVAVFASLLAHLIERRRAQEEARVLARLAERLAGCATPTDISEAVRDESLALFDWDCQYFATRAPGSDVLTTQEFVDTVDGARRTFPGATWSVGAGQTAQRRVLGGEAVLANEADPTLAPFGSGLPSASRMYAPVRSLGQVSGVLSVQSYTPQRYGLDELEALRRLADLIAPALERAYAEDALRESEARYRLMADHATDIISRHALDGTILYASPACRCFGYEPEAIAGHSVYEFIHPADADTVAASFAAPDWATRTHSVRFRARRHDGEYFWIESSARAISGPGEQIEWVAVSRDVTQAARLEEQLRQASKLEAVGQLAGGVAHDFNNLLTTIIGFTDFLLEQLPPNQPCHDDAEQIRRAADRAATLTRQLLAFSRRQVIEPRALDLNAVVGDTERMLQRVIGEPIRLATRLHPEPLAVVADPGQIEQVLLNLVVNARDAMPDGGVVGIETAPVVLAAEYAQRHLDVRPGRYVSLTVRDTGLGMSDEIRERMYEPFFTTKPLGHGTGLGLATVYGIVKQNGGHIECHSRLGAGTTFVVYLPAAEAPVSSAEATRPARPAPAQGTILLVEDEAPVRELTRRILADQGYAVLDACDAEAAQEVAEAAGRLDLLLTDVVLPGLDGRQLAERLQASRPGLPVVFMSGYAEAVIAQRGLLAPGTRFLQKPFSPARLAATVREVLAAEGGAEGSS